MARTISFSNGRCSESILKLLEPILGFDKKFHSRAYCNDEIVNLIFDSSYDRQTFTIPVDLYNRINEIAAANSTITLELHDEILNKHDSRSLVKQRSGDDEFPMNELQGISSAGVKSKIGSPKNLQSNDADLQSNDASSMSTTNRRGRKKKVNTAVEGNGTSACSSTSINVPKRRGRKKKILGISETKETCTKVPKLTELKNSTESHEKVNTAKEGNGMSTCSSTSIDVPKRRGRKKKILGISETKETCCTNIKVPKLTELKKSTEGHEKRETMSDLHSFSAICQKFFDHQLSLTENKRINELEMEVEKLKQLNQKLLIENNRITNAYNIKTSVLVEIDNIIKRSKDAEEKTTAKTFESVTTDEMNDSFISSVSIEELHHSANEAC